VRHPAEEFLKCGSARLTKDDKVQIAMAVYLALEAINESAPVGCDGKPAELVMSVGEGVVVVQDLLEETLKRLGAPVPEPAEVEVQEGHCACGSKLEDEDYN